MDSESSRLLDDFYSNNFLKNLEAMSGGIAPGETSSPSIPVHLNLTVDQPFAHLKQDTDECYQLQVRTRGDGSVVDVDIKARTYYGLRHGLESLSQLVGWNERRRCFHIHSEAKVKDEPAYYHRGVMVDTARHFVPLDILGKVKNVGRSRDIMFAILLRRWWTAWQPTS